MALIRSTLSAACASQPIRCGALVLVLPTLLAIPGQVGTLLLHRHAGAPTHVHRLAHPVARDWHDHHAGHHSHAEREHHDPHESGAGVGAADVAHDTPILVLAKEHWIRSIRIGHLGTPRLALAMPSALAAVAEPRPIEFASGLPPPDEPGSVRTTLDTMAALLLRNHALLL